MISDFVNIKEKLDAIDEELDSTSLSMPINIEKKGTDIIHISLPHNIVLEIPEGVTSVQNIDWIFYSVMPGTGGRYATSISEVIFPSTINRFHYMFGIQPQYTIKLTFKCDVVEVFMNMLNSEDNYRSTFTENTYIKLINAKDSKKEEIFKKWISGSLGIPYTKTEFNFEVPLDFNEFNAVELN